MFGFMSLPGVLSGVLGGRSGCGDGSLGGLGGLGCRPRHDTDALLGLGRVLELDPARGLREDRVVVAEARAGAGEECHAALADQDRAGRDELAVADLDAEALTDAVATVLRARARFLVCHRYASSPVVFAPLARLFLGLGLSSASVAWAAGSSSAAAAASAPGSAVALRARLFLAFVGASAASAASASSAAVASSATASSG